MQKILIIFTISLFPFSTSAQLESNEHNKLLQVLLSDEFTYDDKENIFSTRNDLVLKAPVTEFFTIQEKEFVVIWLQSEDSFNMFSRVAIYQYRKLKKGFERVDELIIRNEQRTWQMETTTIMLGEKEIIEIKAGYNSDGDGDEIIYYLVLPQEESLTLILDHVLESSSGDGCEGENLVSTIAISEELTDSFPNLLVEDSIDTFSFCDENFENRCSGTKKYVYVWDGAIYSHR